MVNIEKIRVVDQSGLSSIPGTTADMLVVVDRATDAPSATLPFPTNPIDGQIYMITSRIEVTALTLDTGSIPISGGVTSILAGEIMGWIYDQVSNRWFSYFPNGKLNRNGDGSALTGLTKSQVGLSNVDNTSDSSKPISSATQTALDAKLATSGNGSSLTGLNKTQVGLSNVDNTSDANKPVSSATQTALNGKLANTTTSGVAATPTASGTTTVTHNLGRVPTTIRIYSMSSFTANAAAVPVPCSIGTWNSTGNRCLYMVINGTSSQVSQTSTTFSIILVTSAGNQITGIIGNVTSTSFDIVWTETGTHTAGNYLWEAQ